MVVPPETLPVLETSFSTALLALTQEAPDPPVTVGLRIRAHLYVELPAARMENPNLVMDVDILVDLSLIEMTGVSVVPMLPVAVIPLSAL
jgi:hypothetical protein